MQSGHYQNASEVMREGLRLSEQRVAEDTAKVEALRQATSIGIMDLEHGHFNQVNEADLEYCLEDLRLEATLPTRKKHRACRGIGFPVRRAPTLSPSSGTPHTQLGDQARRRYQALILAALRALADTPHRIGSHERDELAPGLRSYHLINSPQLARQTDETVKSSCHIVFYRVANDGVLEVVRLLHYAMEVQSHLPHD